MIVDVKFEPVPHANRVHFVARGLTDVGVLEDEVVLDESAPRTCTKDEDALTTYAFWLDLRTAVARRYGSRLPILICNDTGFMDRLHRRYCEQTGHTDAWPFFNRPAGVAVNPGCGRPGLVR